MNGLNLAGMPKELRLILAIINEKEGHDLFKDIDWDLFLSLAMHHRIYPMLYMKIKLSNVKPLIPSFVFEHLQKHYRQNTFQMMHFGAATEQVSQLFANKPIQVLFLKGPTLGLDLYDDISLRTSGDIDILIPIGELDHTERLLQANGFEKNDYINTVLGDWKWRHHHVVYFHPNMGLKLEVHWRLHPWPSKEPHFGALWARKTRSTLTNSPVYTLGREDLFVYLIAHGARHGWSRLRWLLDIHQLLQQEVDWPETNKLLINHRLRHVAGQGVFLAAQVFGTNKPLEADVIGKRSKSLANMAMFYLESMINLHTDPVPAEVSRYHKHYLFALMPFGQKILFMLSFLYPYPEDKETLPLPRRLHLMYFPLRPFLWVWRKMQRQALFKGER